MAYVRFGEGRTEKCQQWQLASRLLYVMARIAAEYLIRRLTRSGFVVMRATPGAAPTTATMPSSIG